MARKITVKNYKGVFDDRLSTGMRIIIGIVALYLIYLAFR